MADLVDTCENVFPFEQTVKPSYSIYKLQLSLATKILIQKENAKYAHVPVVQATNK